MSQLHSSDDPLRRLTIRTYQERDQAIVERLYTEGLLAGQIDPNDTAADIDHLHDTYFSDERDHFWIAELYGQVLGMIGVLHDENMTAEIRRLRAVHDWQNTLLPARLLETAVAHCRRHGFVKVVLDTRFERTIALDLFTRLGFQHTRTKAHHGRETLEFYLDIYRPKKHEGA